MTTFLPSWPYPPPDQTGFWEPVTSTLQWCEEDYYATYYSAEIMNTLTNLMFWYCAIQGVKSCRQNGHDKVFEVAYLGYLAVGFGSFMFHTSLKYPWQLVDELNMIYTTCLMGYASLSHRRSTRFCVILAIACVVFCAGVTAYYHYLQDPLFHQNVYAAMTIWLVLRSAYKMELALRPKWRHSLESDRVAREKKGMPVPTKEENARRNRRDLNILRNMWILVAWGVFIFLSGFALWGIDNKYCSTLRSWRRSVGLPWGIVLEGHGWWHLFTGYGAYCYIVWGIHLRHILNGAQDEYEMIWPHFWSLPEIVRKSKPTANGTVANGSAK